MKPFFFLDFFQTAGAKAALAAGIFLTGLGVIVLFFPELLQILIGGGLLVAGVPLLVYGIRAFLNLNRGGTGRGNTTIYYSKEPPL